MPYFNRLLTRRTRLANELADAISHDADASALLVQVDELERALGKWSQWRDVDRDRIATVEQDRLHTPGIRPWDDHRNPCGHCALAAGLGSAPRRVRRAAG